MNALAWDLSPDEQDEPASVGQARPALVSLHFIRSALRRGLAVCILSGMLGMLAAGAFLLAFPPPHEASATLLLAHDPQMESIRAAATDVGLVSTRAVAQRTIKELRLDVTPERLSKSVTVDPNTSDLLLLRLTAPTDTEAERRLNSFTQNYLAFRAEQLSAQSDAQVDGMTLRIADLNKQIAVTSKRIVALSASGADAEQLGDFISQRAELGAKVGGLEDAIQEEVLRTTSVVAASSLIDPAAVDPHGWHKRAALALAAGLIGGTAAGVGLVLFRAITSDRLRYRVEVAAALDVPVPVSVGKVTPLHPLVGWLPGAEARSQRRIEDRQRLGFALEKAIPVAGPQKWLAVGCLDNADEVAIGIIAAADALQRQARVVNLIDLTAEGHLQSALSRFPLSGESDHVILARPKVSASLVRDETDIDTLEAASDNHTPSLDPEGIFLILTDLDPAVGAGYLTGWTERVIIAVTAGRSSAERIRTASDLVRSAGLDLQFALLLRADKRDESSGVAWLAPEPQAGRADRA